MHSVHPGYHWEPQSTGEYYRGSACIQYIRDTIGNHKVLVSITESRPVHLGHRGEPQNTGEYYRESACIQYI